MKSDLVIVMLAWMFAGCAHREYYNIHKHPEHDIESDKARCTYLAESRVPLAQQQKEWDRDRRVRRLRDLCLKARGWHWRYKE